MQWFFDFVSPYAYLQSTRLAQFEDLGRVDCVPVLFAGLLSHWGHTGPAELAPKRRFTFEDVSWKAARDGIPLSLPREHPFNPLPLLRLCIAAGSTPAVVRRIFDFVWAEGHLPDEAEHFDALLAELGVARHTLESDEIKRSLRANTAQAIAHGVFGVPTLVVGEHRVWGYEATDMAIACARADADADPRHLPVAALARARALPEGSARRPRSAPASQHPAAASGPRLPYLPKDLDSPAELVRAIRTRRGGELLELDRLLLYSPALAEGWNTMMGAVRDRFEVDAKLRELAMCVVAVVNRAEYEFFHHAPLLLAAGGTPAQVQALRDPPSAVSDHTLFDETERACLALAVEMTQSVAVGEATFARCRSLLEPRHLVELIATIAAYNMVSRFLVALDVQPSPETSR